jgi:carboxyl-terminal processing protease
MNRTTKAVVLTLSLAVFAYVSIGFVLGKTNQDKTYRALSVFTEVLQHIQNDYVEDPNMPLVTTGALHGLLESLDPLSCYLSPREFADYKKNMENGARGDIGAAISKRSGYVIVVSVLPESQAERAGLRPGDVLESIAGFTTREMSVTQAQVLLAGEPGTSVKLSVVRRTRTEPREVNILRAEREPPKMDSKLLAEPLAPAGSGIGYLRLPALLPGAADELRQKLLQLEKQGARKLVLDLRDTALGPPSEGIAAARLFLSAGKIATLRGQTVPAQDFLPDAGKTAWKHPVTVLISGGTYGAAEILAAAIGQNRRGELIGETTFGSASEQKAIPLEDGAALILTVANYFGPDGRNISEEGVKPGLEVRRVAQDVPFAGEEAGPGAATDEPDDTPPGEDVALKRAIEMLLAPQPVAPAGEKKSESRRALLRLPAVALLPAH